MSRKTLHQRKCLSPLEEAKKPSTHRVPSSHSRDSDEATKALSEISPYSKLSVFNPHDSVKVKKSAPQNFPIKPPEEAKKQGKKCPPPRLSISPREEVKTLPQVPMSTLGKLRISSLDELKIEEILGQGNFGVVQKCLHIPSNSVVAVKKIPLSADPEQRNAIIQEVKTLNSCKNQNVIFSYGAIVDKTTMNIIIEYMDKGTLEAALKSSGRIQEDVIGHIAYQVLTGLDYLHRTKKIIHRDIKPSNLLLSSEGLVKISDFGTAGIMSYSDASKNSFVGTLTYMSPERLMEEGYHQDSDIWSLGLTLLQCAIGRYPFPEPDPSGNIQVLSFWGLINYIIEMPAPVAPAESSEDLKDFLKTCLGKTSGSRSSAKDLLSHPFILKNTNPISFSLWLESLQDFS